MCDYVFLIILKSYRRCSLLYTYIYVNIFINNHYIILPYKLIFGMKIILKKV